MTIHVPASNLHFDIANAYIRTRYHLLNLLLNLMKNSINKIFLQTFFVRRIYVQDRLSASIKIPINSTHSCTAVCSDTESTQTLRFEEPKSVVSMICKEFPQPTGQGSMQIATVIVHVTTGSRMRQPLAIYFWERVKVELLYLHFDNRSIPRFTCRELKNAGFLSARTGQITQTIQENRHIHTSMYM